MEKKIKIKKGKIIGEFSLLDGKHFRKELIFPKKIQTDMDIIRLIQNIGNFAWELSLMLRALRDDKFFDRNKEKIKKDQELVSLLWNLTGKDIVM